MAEVKTYLFNFKEIAEALIKKQDLHEGLWAIYMEFGLAGANINPGPSPDVLVPAAIVPVMKIGIQRFNTPNVLTVDAAEANPATPAPSTVRRGPRARLKRTEQKEQA